MSYFEDVREFHIQILGMDDTTPHELEPSLMRERFEFIAEEMEELVESYSMGDMTGMADALADLVYVALGTAHRMGIPFDEVWAAVQKANMTKVRGTTKRGHAIDAVKPVDWVGPETAITEALYRANKS